MGVLSEHGRMLSKQSLAWTFEPVHLAEHHDTPLT